jgi:hypothetical protein
MTTNSETRPLEDLLAQVGGEIKQVSAAGAYDSRNCYDAIGSRKARGCIPPRRGARIWRHGNTKAESHIRDENLRATPHGARRGLLRMSL